MKRIIPLLEVIFTKTLLNYQTFSWEFESIWIFHRGEKQFYELFLFNHLLFMN